MFKCCQECMQNLHTNLCIKLVFNVISVLDDYILKVVFVFCGLRAAPLFTDCQCSSYSSTVQSGAMLCSWVMAASSFRNSENSMMANTRLLA